MLEWAKGLGLGKGSGGVFGGLVVAEKYGYPLVNIQKAMENGHL